MTQGVFVNGRRPASKKEVKEAVLANPEKVTLEATSFFGNEYDGPVTEMPMNKLCFFVGPDPFTKRNFYGQIIRSEKGIVVK